MRIFSLATILLTLGAWTASGSVIYGFFVDSNSSGTITNPANPVGGAPTPTGDTLTLFVPGLMADGVTFDATLTVQGFDLDDPPPILLTQNTGGLGVDSDPGDPSELVNDLESLGFSMAVSNFVGETVTFDGFTEIDFNNFGASDEGVLSLDNDFGAPGNFFSTTTGAGDVDISGTLPLSFFAIAANGTGSDNTFRIDNLSGQFTGTLGGAPIPEPATYAMLAMLLLAGVYGVRRRV